jgi:hypothetical protein
MLPLGVINEAAVERILNGRDAVMKICRHGKSRRGGELTVFDTPARPLSAFFHNLQSFSQI